MRGYTHGIGARVREYLESRQNVTVYVHKMVDDLGFEKRQIQSAIAAMIYKQHAPILVVQRGRVWRWVAQGENSTERAMLPATSTVPVAKTANDHKQMNRLHVVREIDVNKLLCVDGANDLWVAKRIKFD